MDTNWPRKIWIVRHGQSAGNVARDQALAAKLKRIEVPLRDVDVALSALGQRQADALGHWFADHAPEDRPDVVLSSPYVRAVQTAQRVGNAGGVAPGFAKVIIDERLREKELGVLDGYTSAGVAEFLPEQAKFRQRLGKFYHRAPGGENWCDVILRLRSVVDMVCLHHSGRNVLIVAHQVVVSCFRYLLENMTEEQILAIDRHAEVANCSVTEYEYRLDAEGGQGGLVLGRYNFVPPMKAEGAVATSAPDANVATR
jgi:broad specificity phosphatase PhoE